VSPAEPAGETTFPGRRQLAASRFPIYCSWFGTSCCPAPSVTLPKAGPNRIGQGIPGLRRRLLEGESCGCRVRHPGNSRMTSPRASVHPVAAARQAAGVPVPSLPTKGRGQQHSDQCRRSRHPSATAPDRPSSCPEKRRAAFPLVQFAAAFASHPRHQTETPIITAIMAARAVSREALC
jgi:hypothetical protein